MRFQVPQFIEVEDKIFGPLTFKQFLYLAGGAGLSAVLWVFLPTFIAILLIMPVIALSLALAFYKVNNKPFANVVEAFFKYITANRLYIWKKEYKKKKLAEKKGGEAKEEVPTYVPKLSESKLKDLTWNLDIRENQNITTRSEKNPVSGL